jgi:peroxiredoxin
MIGRILAQTQAGEQMRSLRYTFTVLTSVAVGAGALLTAIGLMMLIATTVRSASTNGIPEAGKAAPEFALSDLNSRTFRLSQLHGKPALIVFWADWCPDCKRMIPEFNRMYLQGVPIVGINLMEDHDRVAAAVEREPIRYPVLLDTDGEIGRIYGVEAIPNVFVIDSDGRVVHHGFTSPETIPQVQNLFRSITR